MIDDPPRRIVTCQYRSTPHVIDAECVDALNVDEQVIADLRRLFAADRPPVASDAPRRWGVPVARAEHIWLVQHPTTQIIIAAFTVRHELESWLARRLDDDTLLPQSPVWRVRDGWRTGEHVLLGTAADLIGGNHG